MTAPKLNQLRVVGLQPVAFVFRQGHPSGRTYQAQCQGSLVVVVNAAVVNVCSDVGDAGDRFVCRRVLAVSVIGPLDGRTLHSHAEGRQWVLCCA